MTTFTADVGVGGGTALGTWTCSASARCPTTCRSCRSRRARGRPPPTRPSRAADVGCAMPAASSCWRRPRGSLRPPARAWVRASAGADTSCSRRRAPPPRSSLPLGRRAMSRPSSAPRPRGAASRPCGRGRGSPSSSCAARSGRPRTRADRGWASPAWALERPDGLADATRRRAVTGSWHLPGARLLDLVAVMDRLRSPGGCPWTRSRRTRRSSEYLVEEAYETVEAIESDDDDALREELGDLCRWRSTRASRRSTTTVEDRRRRRRHHRELPRAPPPRVRRTGADADEVEASCRSAAGEGPRVGHRRHPAGAAGPRARRQAAARAVEDVNGSHPRCRTRRTAPTTPPSATCSSPSMSGTDEILSRLPRRPTPPPHQNPLKARRPLSDSSLRADAVRRSGAAEAEAAEAARRVARERDFLEGTNTRRAPTKSARERDFLEGGRQRRRPDAEPPRARSWRGKTDSVRGRSDSVELADLRGEDAEHTFAAFGDVLLDPGRPRPVDADGAGRPPVRPSAPGTQQRRSRSDARSRARRDSPGRRPGARYGRAASTRTSHCAPRPAATAPRSAAPRGWLRRQPVGPTATSRARWDTGGSARPHPEQAGRTHGGSDLLGAAATEVIPMAHPPMARTHTSIEPGPTAEAYPHRRVLVAAEAVVAVAGAAGAVQLMTGTFTPRVPTATGAESDLARIGGEIARPWPITSARCRRRHRVARTGRALEAGRREGPDRRRDRHAAAARRRLHPRVRARARGLGATSPTSRFEIVEMPDIAAASRSRTATRPLERALRRSSRCRRPRRAGTRSGRSRSTASTTRTCCRI